MPRPMRLIRRRPLTRTGPAVTLAGWLLAAIAAPAAAEVQLDADGVAVGGRIVNAVSIDRLAQGRVGHGSSIRLEAGRVERTRVGGNLAVRLMVGRLVQQAAGHGALAVTVVGAVSDTVSGGDLTNTVMVGTSRNIAIGAGALACTELGILGPSGACR